MWVVCVFVCVECVCGMSVRVCGVRVCVMCIYGVCGVFLVCVCFGACACGVCVGVLRV